MTQVVDQSSFSAQAPGPADPATQSAEDFAASKLRMSDHLMPWQLNVFDNLLKVHEYERERLGQELHDSAGQLLVSLQLSVARLRGLEADRGHKSLLDEISETVGQIDQEIRALAFLHCPMPLGDNGICNAIDSLARGFEKRTGIHTSFNHSDDMKQMNEDNAVALLRVTQEALVNVYRHAKASSAKISLRKRVDSLELTVSDNGIGIALKVVKQARGVGLRGMRHRIEALGGSFRVTALKRGTRIYATVPAFG